MVRARLWNSTFVRHYSDVHEVRLASNAELILDPAQGVEESDLSDNAFSVGGQFFWKFWGYLRIWVGLESRWSEKPLINDTKILCTAPSISL